MKTRLFLAICILVISSFLCTLGSDATALEKLKEPGAEYSADVLMETENNVMKYKVYYALGGKQRQDMDYQDNQQIMILRQDKKVSWMLMPDQKMYMETSLEQPAENNEVRDMSDCEVDATPAGSESINGVTSSKSKVSMSCPNNVGYEGYMWVTKEGIMVKMDATAIYEGKKTHVKTELKNLKIGKLDPSLFEIPAGYNKFNMSGFGNMMPQGMSEEASAPDQTETGDAAKTSTGGDDTSMSTGQEKDKDTRTIEKTDKVLDTVGKLKGLFGK